MNISTQIGALTIKGSSEGAAYGLRLSGQAEMRDGAVLWACLLQCHREALTGKAKKVQIDLKEVEFMNSTSLGAFVSWVAALQKLPVADRYTLEFLGSPARRRQRASLHALASFAPETILITFS